MHIVPNANNECTLHGTTTEEDILGLSKWLGFSYFYYKQWGGIMILVSALSNSIMHYSLISII